MVLDALIEPQKDYFEFIGELKDKQCSEFEEEILEKLNNALSYEDIDVYIHSFSRNKFNKSQIQENTSIASSSQIDSFWNSIRKKFEKEDILPNCSTCPICGLTFYNDNFFKYNKTVEHVLPKSLYNQFVLLPQNLFFMCGFCNGSKSDNFSENMFHPYYLGKDYLPSVFSIDLCLTEPKGFSQKNAFLVIKINSSNSKDYELLHKIYKVKNKYRDFIEKILNNEISSIGVILKKDLDKIKSIDNKIEFLVRYLKKVYHFNVTNKYFNAEIEFTLKKCIIGMIENQPELFAKYIYDRLNV